MTMTVFVMILVIVWAIRQIVKELGVMDIARNELRKKYDRKDDD